MRFLVDRCAGRGLAEWLGEQGHDVVDASGFDPDPGDDALLAMAAAEGRVVVTLDTDFGTMIFTQSIGHSGLVRLPDVRVPERIQLMEQVLATHGADLVAGAVVTVSGTRIRVRRP